MKQQIAALLLVGFASTVFAQGDAQPPGAVQPPAPGQLPPSAKPKTESTAPHENAQLPFETVDKNGDGQLSRVEAGGVTGLDFSKADVNQNASLDLKEYAAAIRLEHSQQPNEPPR